jgi:hypothetical protein
VIPGSCLIPGPSLIPANFLDDSLAFPYAPRRDTSPQREACYLEG